MAKRNSTSKSRRSRKNGSHKGRRSAVRPRAAESLRSLGQRGKVAVRWGSTKGPKAWSSSELLHREFDLLAGSPAKRRRLDKIDPAVFAAMKARLDDPAIVKVRTWTDKRVAHAERVSASADPIPIPTYNDIDTALQVIVGITNFLSASLLYDAAFGSIVPTPQFDTLAGLDQPWITTENLPLLQEHWDQLSAAMDKWADYQTSDFLPPPKAKTG